MLILFSLVGCAVAGTLIGWHASVYRGHLRASGIVSGAFWGPLAILMSAFDWPYLVD